MSIRNTAQDAHNDRMYKLEQERLRQEQQRNEDRQNASCVKKRENSNVIITEDTVYHTENMKGIVSFSSFIVLDFIIYKSGCYVP